MPPKKKTFLKKDLSSVYSLTTTWQPDNAAASLDAVYAHLLEQANDTIDWYVKAKRWKRMFASNIRLFMIVGGALAAALPIVADIRGETIKAGYSAIILGVCGALLLIDRFLGFSTGWVRFTTTQLKLRQIVQEFQLDWESERASLAGGQPSSEKIAQMLARCKTFVLNVNSVVREETEGWIQEFQETLKMLDEKAKAQAVASEPGALNLTVTNGNDSFIGENGNSVPGWHLIIDDMPAKVYTGTSAGISNLLPGKHKIRAEGQLKEQVNGEVRMKKVQDEKVINLTGGIAQETLDLK
jgi:hypothetical protein